MARRGLTPQERESCKRLGRALDQHIKIRGIDVLEIANLLGVTDSAVYNRLNGTTPIAAHELLAIADFMQCEPAAFFRDPNDLVKRISAWTPELPLDWSPVNGPPVLAHMA